MHKRDFFKKMQRKRYVTKSYRNPYFGNTSRRVSLRWILLLTAITVSIFAVIFFLLGHQTFDITSIEVEGIEQSDQVIVEESIQRYLAKREAFFFSKKNIFLFDPEELKQTLITEFSFRNLTIERQSSLVLVRVVERTSQLVWETQKQFFLVDREGIAIRSIGESEREQLLSLLPKFVDRNDVEIRVGDQVMTSSETEAVFRFHEHLTSQQIAFFQTEFDRLSGKWVGVLTEQQYYILFDPSSDVDAQAGRLELILKEKIEDTSQLEYIDLRFGDHVYYK